MEGDCLPCLISNYGSLKVGFFSLMTEDFPFVTSGKGVKLTYNNKEAACLMVKTLRNQGAQIVLALTHIGHEKDIEIAKSVRGIDIIFGGHSHDYIPDIVRVGDTFITNGGEKGSYLVRLDIVLGPDGKMDPEKIRYELIPVTSGITPDAEIEALLNDYKKTSPKKLCWAKRKLYGT